MAEPTSDNKITLNVLIEDDDVHEQMFNVTVSLQGIFYDIHPTIQEVYWKRQQISIYGLRLYLGNVPFEQVGNFQLSDEAYLSGVRSVESVWPSGSDVDKRLVHIIVRPRSKQVTKTQRTTTPPTAKSDFDQFIEEFSNTQLNFIRAIRKTTSSTAAAPKNFRAQQSGPDYINIGRPAEKAWFPIVLHHPVFGRFLARLQSTDPIDPKVYQHTSNYFYLSQNLYAEENNNSNARDETIRSSLERLLGGTLVKNSADGVQADGVLAGPEATYIQIMEMKNEIGTGSSDPSIQAAQSYSRYWGNKAARRWLKWCCCPSILIAIAGPWMCVLGAVFLGRPAVQPLTHFLWIGEDPARPSELGYISRVFHSLSLAREELEAYYRSSNPPDSGENPARAFPFLTHYPDSSGQDVHFIYRKSLCPGNHKKPIFLAETVNNDDHKFIVVKFVRNYNGDAHKLLAEEKLAPALLYDGTMHPDDQLGPDFAMVVMEFIQGEDLEWADSHLSRQAFNDIDQAVKLLHSHDFVFGDLREPNVMVLHDSIGRETGRAMLVDFDWCGKDGEGRYPLDINLSTTVKWHEDVGPGAEMKKEHDKYMLEKLRRT